MHIFLADDHVLVADTLAEYLKTAIPGAKITTAASLYEITEKIAKSDSADLIILDLVMPGMNGLDGLSKLRERFPKIPIIMMSGNANRQHVIEAHNRGAAGFLMKNISAAAMVKAIELVLAGEEYLPASIAIMSGQNEDYVQHGNVPATGVANPLRKLTAREREVLSLLIKGRSNKEIARAMDIKEITAAFHLKNVFKKLEASNRTQAAAIALNLSYNLPVGDRLKSLRSKTIRP